MDQGGIIFHVLCSLDDNYKTTPSHHIDSALCVCDTAIIATSHQEARLVSYLEAYLSDLEQRLREWRRAINVSKSKEIFYSKLADVGDTLFRQLGRQLC